MLLGSSVPFWKEMKCNLVNTVIFGKLGKNAVAGWVTSPT